MYLSYYVGRYHSKPRIDTLVILSNYACSCMVYKPKYYEKQTYDTSPTLVYS